jgi:hypothetical protein
MNTLFAENADKLGKAANLSEPQIGHGLIGSSSLLTFNNANKTFCDAAGSAQQCVIFTKNVYYLREKRQITRF